MKKIINGLMSILYPNLCIICGENLLRNEEQVCLKCLSEIPRTNFHLIKNNSVEKRFWGKVPVENATSFFHFSKGSPFQKLLHELKYRDNKEIGIIMGKYAAADLLETNFNKIDIIVPVPLHPEKFRKRGYNQSEFICKGLSKVLEKPIDTTNLRRTKATSTQTKKTVFERYKNTLGIFEVKNSAVFEDKHILIVDDVLTTGATLEAAIQALLTCKNVTISVFTLAEA